MSGDARERMARVLMRQCSAADAARGKRAAGERCCAAIYMLFRSAIVHASLISHVDSAMLMLPLIDVLFQRACTLDVTTAFNGYAAQYFRFA